MTADLNDAFKANIERTLRERGMNKRQLSKLMGVHKDLVRVQLNRPGGVTLRTVQRYSDALGIPVVELITPRSATAGQASPAGEVTNAA